MDLAILLLKIFVACAVGYILFNVGRLIFALLIPMKQEPISLEPIESDYGLLTINPNDASEDWILAYDASPFRIHVLGTPPDTRLLQFLEPILGHSEKIVAEVEKLGSSVKGAELHLLYSKRDTCYFDINLVDCDREIQMGYTDGKGVRSL